VHLAADWEECTLPTEFVTVARMATNLAPNRALSRVGDIAIGLTENGLRPCLIRHEKLNRRSSSLKQERCFPRENRVSQSLLTAERLIPSYTAPQIESEADRAGFWILR
jgi:hypothetical protein